MSQHPSFSLRKDFFALKARVYLAWTGLAWNWCVSVPDARWACGCESFDGPPLSVVGQTWEEACAILSRQIALRRHAVHPWRSIESADANWIQGDE